LPDAKPFWGEYLLVDTSPMHLLQNEFRDYKPLYLTALNKFEKNYFLLTPLLHGQSLESHARAGILCQAEFQHFPGRIY
jgi:hypothetical protein